jgi:hypothetical protein
MFEKRGENNERVFLNRHAPPFATQLTEAEVRLEDSELRNPVWRPRSGRQGNSPTSSVR